MIDLIQSFSKLLEVKEKKVKFMDYPVSIFIDPLCPPNCIYMKSGKNEYKIIHLGKNNDLTN